MIYIKINSKEIPIIGFEVHESVFQYTSYLVITSYVIIPPMDFTLSINNENLEFHVMGVEQVDNQTYSITAYPKAYYDAIGKYYDSVVMDGTVVEAAAQAGIELVTLRNTGLTHWSFPQFKIKRLIDHLTNNAIISDGGCPVIFCNIAGQFVLMDLISDAEPIVAFSGKLKVVRYSTEFTQRVPGAINFVFYDDDTFTEQFEEFIPNQGTGTICCFARTEEERQYQISKARVAFFKALYTAQYTEFEDVMIPITVAGTKIQSADTGVKYMLVEYITQYTERSVETKIKVISNDNKS